jgi:hypothetical protein
MRHLELSCKRRAVQLPTYCIFAFTLNLSALHFCLASKISNHCISPCVEAVKQHTSSVHEKPQASHPAFALEPFEQHALLVQYIPKHCICSEVNLSKHCTLPNIALVSASKTSSIAFCLYVQDLRALHFVLHQRSQMTACWTCVSNAPGPDASNRLRGLLVDVQFLWT